MMTTDVEPDLDPNRPCQHLEGLAWHELFVDELPALALGRYRKLDVPDRRPQYLAGFENFVPAGAFAVLTRQDGKKTTVRLLEDAIIGRIPSAPSFPVYAARFAPVATSSYVVAIEGGSWHVGDVVTLPSWERLRITEVLRDGDLEYLDGINADVLAYASVVRGIPVPTKDELTGGAA